MLPFFVQQDLAGKYPKIRVFLCKAMICEGQKWVCKGMESSWAKKGENGECKDRKREG